MDFYQEFSAIADVYQVKQRNEITTPTNTTGTYLDHLNEHCLLEIFSNPLLSAMDLCSLSKTCSRFNQIIQCEFLKEFDLKFDNKGYAFTSKKFPNLYIQTKDADRILKNFGSHLSSISIHHWDLSLVNLIADYSNIITLKRLGIHESFRWYQDFLVHNRSRTMPVDELAVLEIDVDYDSWFKFAISKPTFTNLEQFIFRQTPPRLESESMIQKGIKATNFFLDFSARHKGLRTLKLYACDMYCRKHFISNIFNTCTHLGKLTLRGLRFFGEDDDSSLHLQLLSLETVIIEDLNGALDEINGALLQTPNLRELRLSAAFAERHFTKNIPWKNLTQLRKLYLNGTTRELTRINVPNVIRELTRLEELEIQDIDRIEGTFELRKVYFDDIVELFEEQKRKNVLTLICPFNFNHLRDCDDNRKVRLVKPINVQKKK